MRTRKKQLIGKDESVPSGSCFKIGKYDYIAGRTCDDGMIEYCSIDRLGFAFAQSRYSNREEHLIIQKDPFIFSRQHINWFRDFLNRHARILNPNEIRNLQEYLNIAAKDGFGDDIGHLIEICSEEK